MRQGEHDVLQLEAVADLQVDAEDEVDGQACVHGHGSQAAGGAGRAHGPDAVGVDRGGAGQAVGAEPEGGGDG